MGGDSAYNIYRRTGVVLTGQRNSLHSARHGLATAMMQRNPRMLSVAAAALGHRTPRTTRRAYDLSGGNASNEVWSQISKRLRRDPAE